MDTGLPTAELLLVEDEPGLARALCQGLMEQGYTIAWAANGEDALYRFVHQQAELVILDLNLPGRDGLDLLTTLRRLCPELRVLIVSARDTVEDRVLGLNTGADDYLVKPFAFPELVARVAALKRRASSQPMLQFQVADLDVDVVTRRVRRAQRSIDLTPREFQILELLLRNRGAIVSRQTLGREIWRVQRATPLDNVIDVHLMHLRRKIDAPGDTPLLHTVRGVGFLLSDHPYGE